MKPIEIQLPAVSKEYRYGMVLYPFIFYLGEPSSRLRRHEMVHVAQVERLGWFRFYALYLWYLAIYGYWNNPLEVEAREGE